MKHRLLAFELAAAQTNQFIGFFVDSNHPELLEWEHYHNDWIHWTTAS